MPQEDDPSLIRLERSCNASQPTPAWTLSFRLDDGVWPAWFTPDRELYGTWVDLIHGTQMTLREDMTMDF